MTPEQLCYAFVGELTALFTAGEVSPVDVLKDSGFPHAHGKQACGG